MNLFKKYVKLMNSDQKFRFFLIISLSLFSGVLELFGLSLIIPIITLILDPDSFINFINEIDFLSFLKKFTKENLVVLLMGFSVFFYIAKNFYIFFVNWINANFLVKFSTSITSSIFQNYLKKNYTYFTKKNISFFLKTLDGDAVIINNNLNLMGKVIVETFTIVLICSFLLFIQPVVMLSTVIFFIFGSGIFLYIIKKKTKIWAKDRDEMAKAKIQSIKQTFESIKDLKLLNVENIFAKKFNDQNSIFYKANLKQSLMTIVPRLWIEIITVLATIILVGVIIYFSKKIAPLEIIPLLGLYVGASFKMIPSFNSIITGTQSLRFSKPILDEYYKILFEDNAEDEKIQNLENIIFKKRIILKNVSFGYENNKLLLENASLEINLGDKIGIFAKSGSGKSTVLDIITGILKPSSGNIYVDERNINSGLRSWRNILLYLSQKTVFLNDTIKSNILLGSTKFDENLFVQAIINAQLEDFINGLPKKENTFIGENAVMLSGGERQRLALARLFYLERDFIILDESTSAIDKRTEEKILKNIFNVFSKKTIIIASHDTRVLKYCNKVYSIKDKNILLNNSN
jgi:ABC-type multidrug transport system fused ATPase/permease subunit